MAPPGKGSGGWPVDYHPQRTAPIGSTGNQWDGKVEFPADPRDLLAIQEETERRRRQRLEDPRSYTFKGKVTFRPPMGWLAIHAWLLLVLGLFSTGPLGFLQVLFFAGAIVVGFLGWLRLRNRRGLERGEFTAAIAAAAGLICLAARFLLPMAGMGWPL